MDFIFVSRHQPTVEQLQLAEANGHTLTHVGDVDAFDRPAVVHLLRQHHQYHGIVAVHPLVVAIAAQKGWNYFGFFRNVNRAPVGEKPQFATDLFVVEKLVAS